MRCLLSVLLAPSGDKSCLKKISPGDPAAVAAAAEKWKREREQYMQQREQRKREREQQRSDRGQRKPEQEQRERAVERQQRKMVQQAQRRVVVQCSNPVEHKALAAGVGFAGVGTAGVATAGVGSAVIAAAEAASAAAGAVVVGKREQVKREKELWRRAHQRVVIQCTNAVAHRALAAGIGAAEIAAAKDQGRLLTQP